MSNPKKPASLFGDDDDDDEGLPKARAKRAAAAKGEDNPLSFFSFGSAAVAPAASSKATSAAKSLFGSDDEDDDDDEFFKSPPGSLKKPVKKAASSSFDLSDEDEIELPRDGSNGSLLSTLSFKAAVGVSGDRPASAEPSRSTGAGAGTENLRIVALEEQLVKANKTIKKLQDKAKSDEAQLETALQGIESNIAKHTDRANKAEQTTHRLEKEMASLKEQLAQSQAQNRQQAAIIQQMNHSGVPIPSAAPADLDWYSVHEKHQLAMRMLSQASQEAHTGLELLTKNAPVLVEVLSLLKDVGKISDERASR